MAVDDVKELERQSEVIKKAIAVSEENKRLKKEKEEQEKKIEQLKKESLKKTKVEIVDAPKHKPLEGFKKEEKRTLNPLTWFKPDKTNPVTMVIFSPAGDLTIRERIVDTKGNLTIGKNSKYRVEHKEIWDMADSDIKGFSGKKVLFYFQDVPHPLSIRRDDDDLDLNVNTDNYSKAMESHLLSELLSPDMKFTDYISLVMTGINIVLTIVILVKLFIIDKGAS